MLVEHLLSKYGADTDLRGNPIRGSRLGACQREIAYALWPGLYDPEPLLARRRMVFAMGRDVEARLRKDFRAMFPGQWGMEEETFFFAVPLDAEEVRAANRKIESGVLTGWIRPEFHPHGDLVRWREYAATLRAGNRPANPLVLDPLRRRLWVPIHVDGIVDLSAHGFGLATVELKSYSSPGFRRVEHGGLDYGYRVQLAVAAEASGLDTAAWVFYKKETSHLLELIYSRRAERVALRVVRMSGHVEEYRPGETVIGDEDAFGVYHPFEPDILESARQRVRNVLRATPEALPAREYGPDLSFRCAKCGGLGHRFTPKRRDQKPCKECAGAGRLEETALAFPCSWCPQKARCWPIARTELTAGKAPRFIVRRSDVDGKGYVIEPPEPEEPPTIGPEETETPEQPSLVPALAASLRALGIEADE